MRISTDPVSEPFWKPWLKSPKFRAAALLALLTLGVFWPVCTNEFVDYDDNLYVTENLKIQRDFTPVNVLSLFTEANANNYHPFTAISHMIDFQLYGLNPAGHHATNLIFHIVNSVLLFCVLLRLTGGFWPSFVAAAIFQLHPLRVESVAWVAERKDVLSMFFALLAIYFYVGHARSQRAQQEGAAQETSSRNLRWSLVFFICGLLSKPMLITLPFLLVLLDYWPLGRLQVPDWPSFKGRLGELMREKQWFFLLIVPAAFLTIWAQSQGGAVKSTDDFPFWLRLENAPVAIVKYLAKTFCPMNMAVLYPYPASFSIAQVAGAIVSVVVITIAVFRFRRRFPFLPVGWLWFLGSLVPVIGLIQAGEQSMADRFVYLPSIGLIVAVTWLVSALVPRTVQIGLAVVTIVACVVITEHQLPFWKTRYALFEHTTAVTENNYVAHYNMGDLLLAKGNPQEALAHYREAIRIKPSRPEPRNNYAKALAQVGRGDDSIQQFLELIRDHPKYAKAYSNLGAVLVMLNKPDEAELSLKRAVKLDPSDPDSQMNYANLLYQKEKAEEALEHYGAAILLKPKDATPHYWSARLLTTTKPKEALEHLKAAVYLRPDWVAPKTELAWHLATQPKAELRDGKLARQLATEACELTKYQDLKAIASLEVATAEQGQFAEAIDIAKKEIEVLKKMGQTEKVDSIQQRIGLYRAGKPFHQP